MKGPKPSAMRGADGPRAVRLAGAQSPPPCRSWRKIRNARSPSGCWAQPEPEDCTVDRQRLAQGASVDKTQEDRRALPLGDFDRVPQAYLVSLRQHNSSGDSGSGICGACRWRRAAARCAQQSELGGGPGAPPPFSQDGSDIIGL